MHVLHSIVSSNLENGVVESECKMKNDIVKSDPSCAIEPEKCVA